jgi:hypothetical protein
MMQEWLMQQVEDGTDDFIYQQDGATPRYHNLVRSYLIQHLPKAGSDARPQQVRRCFAGHQDHLT